MKAIILKDDLDKVLNIVSRFVVNRGQLPVLSNVLIAASKNKIEFSATNLETGINLIIGGKVVEEGSITVPAKNMSEFVSLTRSSEVVLDQLADKLKLTAGKSTAVFAGISANEFPPMPKNETNDKSHDVLLDKKQINNISNQIGYAASTDEARPVLTGIKFYRAGDIIRVAATDGFRLARLDLIESAKSEKNVWSDGLIIPARTVAELSRLVSDRKKDEIVMRVMRDNNQVLFLGSDFVLISRILDGNFPDVDKIVPIEFKTEACIDIKELTEAVKAAAIFARENSNIVKLKLLDASCIVSAVGGQTGEGESEVGAEFQGDQMEIAFNYRYLLDVLNSFDSEKIVLKANGSQTAVGFGSEGGGKLMAIIMPVRV